MDVQDRDRERLERRGRLGRLSVVQAAKTKVHGYRNSETLKAVTDLVAGKLDLRLPT